MTRHILIVDDSPVIRRALRKALEREEGWKVSGEATNGLEGIEKAQQLKPDVILLDLSMPVMNGLEAARELRRRSSSVPLVMYTFFETAHLEQEARSAGIDSIVSKSESLEVLVSNLQTLLEPAP